MLHACRRDPSPKNGMGEKVTERVAVLVMTGWGCSTAAIRRSRSGPVLFVGAALVRLLPKSVKECIV
jgi:hypothetical protein